MILVVGAASDSVYSRLIAQLKQLGHPFKTVDEDSATSYGVKETNIDGSRSFRLVGGTCDGNEPVGTIFVRHGTLRTLDPVKLRPLLELQSLLNRAFTFANCPVVNAPSRSYSNYSKPSQVKLLAQAGFAVPATLVTNIPQEARSFAERVGGEVIFKGVSNTPTFAQLLTAENIERLELLGNSPTLFQECIRGVDYRVHVIAEHVFVTRLVAKDVDYRQSLQNNANDVKIERATLPRAVLDRCVGLTLDLGLTVSGIDFKGRPNGDLVALEVNPYPLYTFYESRDGQHMTRSVADVLVGRDATKSNIFV